MNTIDTLKNLGIGATGVVGIDVIPVVTDIVQVPINNWVQAVTQVVIALATLVSLFGRKRKS